MRDTSKNYVRVTSVPSHAELSFEDQLYLFNPQR